MIHYQDDKQRKNRIINSGEQLDIVGVLRDAEGNELSSTVLTGAKVVMIVRNMNGVVFNEWSTNPVTCPDADCQIRWHSQDTLTMTGAKFKGLLKKELTATMVGDYVVEVRVTTSDGHQFICAMPPITVINDYVKRTR